MSDIIREQLNKPFKEEDIEWRIQQSGKQGDKVWAMCLAYVTNRAIMERLDDVFGVFGWKNEFMPTPHNDGVMCGISVKHDGEWITKYDGAQNTDIEAVKGGISSAMKRTAVQFGIGRYLYDLDAGFAKIVEKGTTGAKYAKGKDFTFYWLPPQLPLWALPQSSDNAEEDQQAEQQEEDQPIEHPRITTEQLEEIRKLIEETESDTEAFCKWLKVGSLPEIYAGHYETAINQLNKKLAEKVMG